MITYPETLYNHNSTCQAKTHQGPRSGHYQTFSQMSQAPLHNVISDEDGRGWGMGVGAWGGFGWDMEQHLSYAYI